MAEPLHLVDKIYRKNFLPRTLDLIIFFLLLSLLAYRLHSLNEHGLTWFLAFLCESWFTFNWILVMNAKWSPVEHKTYPDRLLSRVQDLPSVDLFVTTADPVLEPPIITLNTVLSLLALDYPSNKLACYVSDDGASPITFYALTEAIKFAKLWVPFCKKYNIKVRAPFRYFGGKEFEACGEVSSEFQKDWTNVKIEYGEVCRKIEEATRDLNLCDSTGEIEIFSKIDRRNHPSIIKVIWENKENITNGVPHLIYISREKRPKHPHHYKGGAMNVLTRVSGVMTNAPFMLNVDCDMFANNPQIALQAMCFFLDSETKHSCAFVQSPQCFYGSLKDDPFGNSMIVLYEVLGRGLVGLQGPFYVGTGCFHRREVIYGLSPEEVKVKGNKFTATNKEALKPRFGYSIEFVESAAQSLSGKTENLIGSKDLSRSLKAAIKVADCIYETNTQWGTKIGWVYGSITEDILTGIGIHAKGWESVYCFPKTPAFLGCAPSGGPACMIQQKRWATGLLEILVSSKSPIIAWINQKLRFRQCLAYLHITLWGLRSIPELCYSVLPAYCMITNTSFLPMVSDATIWIPASILVIYNLYTMYEYRRHGLSVRAWWNNQRMMRITTISAWTFGVISVILKLIGLSETVFEVAQKDQNEDSASYIDPGRFTFDDSPMFVLGTGLVLTHITALILGLLRLISQGQEGYGPGLGEIVSSIWVVLTFLPFVKGLFRKGKYGIPTATICKAAALVGFFVQFTRWVSMS